MRSAAATTPCRPTAVWLGLLLAACASGSPAYDPGQLDAERAAKCRAAEIAYRNEAPEYAALRDELTSDPVAVHWLVRMFVRDLILVREGRPLDDTAELFMAAAGIENPVERRAIGEIEALGAKAVPTIVGDLLRHSQPQPRELGIELIARIGDVALPELLPMAHSGEPRERRTAARALGMIGNATLVEDELFRLAHDADFTVRADAMRGLMRGSERGAAVLRATLAADPDPFVRRVAAQSLARHPSQATAKALVEYLQRCQRDDDRQGEKAAQASLQVLAGTRGMRTLAAWRAWLADQGR